MYKYHQPLTALFMVFSLALFVGCKTAEENPLVKDIEPVIRGMNEPPGEAVSVSARDLPRTGPEEYRIVQAWLGKSVGLMSKGDLEAALYALHQTQAFLPQQPGDQTENFEAYSMAVLNGKARVYLLLENTELTESYIDLANKAARREIDRAVLDQTRACQAYQQGEFEKAVELGAGNQEPLAVMLRDAALFRAGEPEAKTRLQDFYQSTQNPEHIHMLPSDVKALATENLSEKPRRTETE